MWIWLLACSSVETPAPPPPAPPAPPAARPRGTPAPVRMPEGTVGVVRRPPGGGPPQVVFPSVRKISPTAPVAPPPPSLTVRWVGDAPDGAAATFDVTGLAWTDRCTREPNQDGEYILAAPVPEALAPAQPPTDERGGVVGFVVVGWPAAATLAPPRPGTTRRLEASGFAALDEDLEATRTCTSDVEQGTLVVTPSGRFRLGCCP